MGTMWITGGIAFQKTGVAMKKVWVLMDRIDRGDQSNQAEKTMENR